jgi:hypothetical protein
MRGFAAIKCGLCRVKGFKAHHRMGDFPDGALILSNQVIKVFNLYLPWRISRLIKPPGISKQLMLQSGTAGLCLSMTAFPGIPFASMACLKGGVTTVSSRNFESIKPTVSRIDQRRDKQSHSSSTLIQRLGCVSRGYIDSGKLCAQPTLRIKGGQ